jgi:hypothetical protein
VEKHWIVWEGETERRYEVITDKHGVKKCLVKSVHRVKCTELHRTTNTIKLCSCPNEEPVWSTHQPVLQQSCYRQSKLTSIRTQLQTSAKRSVELTCVPEMGWRKEQHLTVRCASVVSQCVAWYVLCCIKSAIGVQCSSQRGDLLQHISGMMSGLNHLAPEFSFKF